MRKAAERRLLVMVNVHRTVADAWPGDGLWYDAQVTEETAIASWISLAQRLCPHWNFFAADLVNEPQKATWGRGSPLDWNKAAERIGDAVLGACPRLLIFVQGVAGEPGAQGDGGVEEGYFWGENFAGVHSAPVRLIDQTKLVYSPHTCAHTLPGFASSH
jgi:endoglucanase